MEGGKELSENTNVCEIRYNMLNEKIEKNEVRINSLEEQKETMAKLETLIEMQTKLVENHDKFLRQQSETLVKINENLTGLNKVTGELSTRVSDMEKEIQASKLEAANRETEDTKQNSLSIPQLIKTIIATAIVTIAVGWIVMASGGKP